MSRMTATETAKRTAQLRRALSGRSKSSFYSSSSLPSLVGSASSRRHLTGGSIRYEHGRDHQLARIRLSNIGICGSWRPSSHFVRINLSRHVGYVSLSSSSSVNKNILRHLSSNSTDDSNDKEGSSSGTNDVGDGDGTDLDTEWIKPDRPLSGDQGPPRDHYIDYRSSTDHYEDDHDEETSLREIEEALAAIERDEELKAKEAERQSHAQLEQQRQPVDWLQTRRSVLKQQQEIIKKQLSSEIYDEEDEDDDDDEEFVLISKREIQSLLSNLGATHINVIYDDISFPRMGGPPMKGMVFCTGSNPFHITQLATALYDYINDKRAQLQSDIELDNDDDEYGDLFSTQYGDFAVDADATTESQQHEQQWQQKQDGDKKARRVRRKTPSIFSSNKEETWRVLDCHDYIVHIQDDASRRRYQLEALWSGKDPLWKLNTDDDNAVDDYVAKHPAVMDGDETAEYLSSLVDEVELKSYHATTIAKATSSVGKKNKKKQENSRQQQLHETNDTTTTKGIISKLEKRRWTVGQESSRRIIDRQAMRRKRSRSLQR